MSRNSNKLFIILAVVLVLTGGYYMFSQSQTVPLEDDMTAEKIELIHASEKIIADTNTVNAIMIDGGFFASTQFRSLVDRRVPLPNIPTGRANPFAPVQ